MTRPACDAPVRASGSEEMAFVSPEGRYLLFQRGSDIYVSFRAAEGAWLPPAPLPAPVNAPDMELCPGAAGREREERARRSHVLQAAGLRFAEGRPAIRGRAHFRRWS